MSYVSSWVPAPEPTGKGQPLGPNTHRFKTRYRHSLGGQLSFIICNTGVLSGVNEVVTFTMPDTQVIIPIIIATGKCEQCSQLQPEEFSPQGLGFSYPCLG